MGAAACLQLHRACPNLKSLHVDFWNPMQPHLHYLMPLAEMSLVEGLTDLSLWNLVDSDSSREWARHIACLLSRSPQLKKLSILLCETTAWDRELDHMIWFDMLCETYGQTGAPPLALQTLHCEPGGTFVECASFHKMVDLQSLEEVRFDSGCAMEVFSAVIHDAPNLRRFSSRMYVPEMHVELSQTMDPIRMQKIAMFFQKEELGVEMASLISPSPTAIFPGFPLQPRMMHIDLDRANALEEWSLDPTFSNLSAAEVLKLLVAGPGREILEGLLVYLPPREIPAISSTPVEALERVLPSLLKLSQLRVITTREVNADLELDSSEIQQQRLQITELAFKLAKAGRQLRYMSVDCYRWKIIWQDDLEMTQLEELSYEEGLEVELFDLTRAV